MTVRFDEIKCENPKCGKVIYDPKPGQRFCNDKCRFAYHNEAKREKEKKTAEKLERVKAHIRELNEELLGF